MNDFRSLVDSELLQALDAFPAASVDFTPTILPMLRAQPDPEPLPYPFPQPARRIIPGPPGNEALDVIILDPAPNAGGKPALLHMHGGGYVMGRPALFVPFLQRIAHDVGCVVVAVTYRLAPETPFPGALLDNYAALTWLHRNADELGVDPTHLAIGGESAGGGHAAMLAIHARDKGEVPVAFQWLIYPMIDDRTGSSRQMPPHLGAYLWSSKQNRFGWESLLGMPAGQEKVPYGSVPSRMPDLAGLPRAYVASGALDLFVEEDVEYARRLIMAGVPTELEISAGAYHGFNIVAPEAAVSR